ncbi:MAG: VWA domain-containing protein [Anaerolineae bacterium]|nr:VWA domain-containing protein [Anaerolineae bacterium]
MMRRWLLAVLVAVVGLSGLVALAQESGAINIAFIFDASGSMMAGMEGRTRLAVAQDAFSQMIGAVPPEANTSLWVYGHRLSQDDPAASCQDIEQVIPLAPLDVAQFETAVRGIHAIGYTPITTSLQLAAQTLVDQPNARNTIVLVSDGEETCGGSPCLMAQALKEANIELTVNTIGFAADDVTRQQLQCIAEVTGGTYYEAPDAAQLGEALQSAVAPPGTVQIVNENGEQLWDVAFQLIDVTTGEAVGDFVGSATVAGGDYRAIVQGDFPLEAVIGVISGETTEVIVASPAQTGIQMVDLAGQPLPEMNFSIVDPATADWLNGGTGILELPPGDYHVVVDTAFPLTFDVTVVDGALTPIQVDPAEGIVRIVDLSGNPLPEMFFSVTDPVSGVEFYGQGEMRASAGLLPVRVRTAFDTVTEATVEDGQTANVSVDPAEGIVRIVDLAGNPLPEMAFSVTDPVSGEEVYGQGEMRVPPGHYPVRIATTFDTLAEAAVGDGQTVDVPVDTAFGTVVLVNLAGEPLLDQGFDIIPPGGEPVYARGQLDVPPGTYTLHVDIQPPVEAEITVADGQRLEVPVNNEFGTIRLVDLSGQPVTDLGFNVTEPSTGDETYATGQIMMPPGEYSVRVDAVFPLETTVTVRVGDTTDVRVDNATGIVQLVDEQGQPLPDLALEIFRDDGQSVYGYGPLAVPPGDYGVQVQTGFSYQTEISVAGGETVNVTVPSTGTLQLVDEEGNPLDELLYNTTRQETGETLSARGPSELPPGQYDVEVFTVFPFETSVEINLGQTADVTVNTAAGTLQLVDEDGNPLNEQLYTAMRQETGETLSARGPSELPPGAYTVQVFTVFPFETEVDVTVGETAEVEVSTAAGTIQLVDENGDPLPDQLFTFTNTETGDSSSATGSQELPPGTYTLDIYTVFPQQVEVTVVAGETAEVEVSTAAGTIQLVDENGDPLPDQLFTFTNTETGDSSSATGSQDVPPGAYTLDIYTVFPQQVEVAVVADEITPVEVDTRTGTVRMVDGRGNAQPTMLFTITRQEDSAATSASGEIEVPPGVYSIDVYTSKPFTVAVEVVEGEVTTINIVSAATNRPAR